MQLEQVQAELDESSLSTELPIAEASLDEILGIGDYLNLGNSIDEYLALNDPDDDKDQTLLGLIGYLKENWLTKLPVYEGLDFIYDEANKSLSLTYQSSSTYTTSFDLALGAEATSFGVELAGDATIDLEIKPEIDFALDFNWADNSSDVVNFNLNKLGFDASANADDLVLGAYFGPLEANIGSHEIDKQQGSASLNFGGNISYTDRDNNASTDKQLEFELTNGGNVDVMLPFYIALDGRDLAPGVTPTLELKGTLLNILSESPDSTEENLEFVKQSTGIVSKTSNSSLASGDITLTHTDFDRLLNFRNFGIVDVLLMFKDIVGWAEDYREYDVMDTSIPFVDFSLGDALDFASAIDDEVLGKIDFYKPREDLASGNNAVLSQTTVDDRVVFELTDNENLNSNYQGKYVTVEGVGIFQIEEVGNTAFSLVEVYDDQAILLEPAENPNLSNLSYTIHKKHELIRTYQELIVAVNKSGILPLDLELEYDPGENTFTIPFGFDYNVPVFDDIGLDFALDMGDLSLSSDAKTSLNASVSGGMEIVIDFDGRVLKDEAGKELKDGDGNTLTAVDIFLDNVELKGEAGFDLTDFEVAAELGFLGLTAGGVGTGSGINFEASIATGLNGRQSFKDLIGGDLLSKFKLDLQGSAFAKLKKLEVGAGFGGFSLDNAELSVYLPNLTNISGTQVVTQSVGQPFDLQAQLNNNVVQNQGTIVVLPDVSELLSLRNLSFADIIGGINGGIGFLNDSLARESFYTASIPVIDKSLQDIFTFLDDLTAKMQEVADNPAGLLQEVEILIESTLGIQDDNTLAASKQKFSLYLENNYLNIHLGWEALLAEEFGFALDLSDFPGAAALEGIDSLVDLNGGSKVNLEAIAKLSFDVAIDLGSLKQGKPEIVLRDYDEATGTGTHAEIGTRLEGTDLNLGFNLGPINFGTTAGSVLLDADGDNKDEDKKDYAGLLLAVDQKSTSQTVADDGFFYLNGTKKETFKDSLQAELNGGFDVNLPLYMDVAGFTKDLGALRMYTNKEAYGEQAFEQLFKYLSGSTPAGAAKPIIFEAPNIKEAFSLFGGDFSLLAMLNDPSAILDGVDMSLSILEDTMDSNLAQDIPLLGDKLGRAASFLRDMRLGVLGDLRQQLEGKGKAIEILQKVLWDVLGPNELNLLLDNNDDEQVTIDDVGVAWFDIAGKNLGQWSVGGDLPSNADAIDFDLKLGGTIVGTSFDLPLDFDLPGFSLDVQGGLGLRNGLEL